MFVATASGRANMFTGWRKQKRAVEETKAVFGALRERIAAAVEKLEGLLVGCLSLFLFLFLFISAMFILWVCSGRRKEKERERNVCYDVWGQAADHRMFDL